MKKSVLKILPLIALPVVLYAVFMILAPGFGLHSLSVVISQTMIPTMTAFGLFILMNTGLMDFSIGSRVVFGAVLGGILAQNMGVVGLILGCFLGGMIASVTMAVLYRFMKIPCMVVSLGIVMIFEVAGAKLVGSSGYLRITSSEYFIGSYPLNIVIVLIAAIGTYFLCYRTRIGAYISAVGDEERMCKNVGINPDRTKFFAIVLTGVFTSLASLLYICYSGSITVASEMSSMAMIFKPIMCVILARFMRKYLDCMPLLIFVGGISITIIFNGFIAMGFSDAVQNIVLGIFLIVILGSNAIIDFVKGIRVAAKA